MNPGLVKMRDELDVAIKQAMKKTQDALQEHKEELNIAFDVALKLDTDPNRKEFIFSLLKEALEDALATINDAERLSKAAALITKHK